MSCSRAQVRDGARHTSRATAPASPASPASPAAPKSKAPEMSGSALAAAPRPARRDASLRGSPTRLPGHRASFWYRTLPMGRRPAPQTVGPHTYDHHDAPLVSGASEITCRAIKLVGAGTLYTFLHLETLAANDLPALQQTRAESEFSSVEAEHAAWSNVATHLRVTIAAVQEIPSAQEHGLRITHADGREPIEVKLVDMLDLIAGAAERLSRRLVEVSLGALGVLPGKLATARKMADLARSRRRAMTNHSVRKRLASLVAALPEWSPGEVADLIVASLSDWDPPPVEIAPKYRFNSAELLSRDRGVATRARARRAALLQWMRDQRKAPEPTQTTGEVKRKRRRKRES